MYKRFVMDRIITQLYFLFKNYKLLIFTSLLFLFFLFFVSKINAQSRELVNKLNKNQLSIEEKDSLKNSSLFQRYIENNSARFSISQRTVTRFDLNSAIASTNYAIITTHGFLYPTFTYDVSVVTSTGTITSVRLFFSINNTGVPVGVQDANEFMRFLNCSGSIPVVCSSLSILMIS